MLYFKVKIGSISLEKRTHPLQIDSFTDNNRQQTIDACQRTTEEATPVNGQRTTDNGLPSLPP